MSKVFLNGQYLDRSEAKISIFDRGFIFGDGIYEVCLVINSTLIDNQYHLERLEKSLSSVEINLDYTRQEIEKIQTKLIEKNNLKEGFVYLQITRGVANRQFHYHDLNLKPTIMLFCEEVDILKLSHKIKGTNIVSHPDIRWAKREIKSTSLLAQVIAKNYADKLGCGEVLFVDDEGKITECGSSNLFIVDENNNIRTRATDGTILEGVTRRALFEVSAKHNLTISTKSFTLNDVLAANEVFITSSIKLVQSVSKVDGKKINNGEPGPITQQFRKIYLDKISATSHQKININ